jgi:protein-disulfide isomerase
MKRHTIMKRNIALAALAVVLAVGLGLQFVGKRDTALMGLPPMAASAQETAPTTAEPAAPVVAEMAIGNPEAKVTVMEYASFTCPHCANFHANVYKDLKKNYIDTGKIRFVFREVYFDRYGLWAAMVARCGGEMRYFGISDIIFDTQSEWAHAPEDVDVVNNLRKIGLTAGMDDAMLDTCLEDGAMAQALITTYQVNAQADDITATPTLLINGVKHSNMSYADLAQIIETELAK